MADKKLKTKIRVTVAGFEVPGKASKSKARIVIELNAKTEDYKDGKWSVVDDPFGLTDILLPAGSGTFKRSSATQIVIGKGDSTITLSGVDALAEVVFNKKEANAELKNKTLGAKKAKWTAKQ